MEGNGWVTKSDVCDMEQGYREGTAKAVIIPSGEYKGPHTECDLMVFGAKGKAPHLMQADVFRACFDMRASFRNVEGILMAMLREGGLI